LSYLIVVNINPIHEWMGRALGIQIWDPKIYYFVKIPNQVNTEAAIVVFLVGVVASAIAALWPAARAANMHPVQALRFE
jgi:lipoprotein-releasing system permease protein